MDVLFMARVATMWVMAKLEKRIDFKSETGATAVEYGVMVALIAAFIILTVAALGSQIKSAFCKVVTSLGSAGIGNSSCP